MTAGPGGVCIVESFASVRRPGALPTQGAQLADLLEADGHIVLRTSSQAHPLARAADMAAFLFRHRREYDVMVVRMFGHRAFSYAQLASTVGRVLRKRIVLVLADGDLARVWARRRTAMSRVLDRADVIVTPSTWLQRLIEPRYCAVAIPNVIDLGRYPFVLRERVSPRLFWARAYQSQYDPLMAIHVAHALRHMHDDVLLTMAGPDQGQRAQCESIVEHLHLGSIVTLHDKLEKRDLIREAARHDIHLHTNSVDNMPVTFLEQMSLGLPIVAAPVGGIPDIVSNRETGLLVREREPTAYVEAIESLLSDPSLAARLSRNGRAFVERTCSWPAVRGAWLEALDVEA